MNKFRHQESVAW